MNPLRRLYRRALHGSQDALAALGLNAARSADYYSPLPLRAELGRRRERWDRPSELVGIDFDLDAMKSLLRRLAESHREEYRRLPGYAKLKRSGYGPGFTVVDGMILFWMIRDLKPKRYIEVGSGLSTYYAWLAVSRNTEEGSPCAMTCIDPYASGKVRTIPGLEVLAQPVQDAGWEVYRSD